MIDEWEMEFDEEFRFRSDELENDGNYQGTQLRNEIKAFIRKTIQKVNKLNQSTNNMDKKAEVYRVLMSNSSTLNSFIDTGGRNQFNKCIDEIVALFEKKQDKLPSSDPTK